MYYCSGSNSEEETIQFNRECLIQGFRYTANGIVGKPRDEPGGNPQISTAESQRPPSSREKGREDRTEGGQRLL